MNVYVPFFSKITCFLYFTLFKYPLISSQVAPASNTLSTLANWSCKKGIPSVLPAFCHSCIWGYLASSLVTSNRISGLPTRTSVPHGSVCITSHDNSLSAGTGSPFNITFALRTIPSSLEETIISTSQFPDPEAGLKLNHSTSEINFQVPSPVTLIFRVSPNGLISLSRPFNTNLSIASCLTDMVCFKLFSTEEMVTSARRSSVLVLCSKFNSTKSPLSLFSTSTVHQS